MDTITENLSLPYLMPSQAQKHVTHNEALRTLDALVQIAVSSRMVSSPPPLPAPGERFIVGAAPVDAWLGKANMLAAWQDGIWTFYSPGRGWLAYVHDESALLVFDGSVWSVATTETALPERLGLNMTATAPDRLALSGEASLFSHEGSNHRLKINKASAGDTASILFQTAWTGYAEFGLTGDNDFHLKVSADGVAFKEAMAVNRSTGKASFPAGVTGMREQLAADRTYYVAAGGSDLNNGLSSGTAFATLQKAVNEAHKLDCSIYNVTIQLAAGTYTSANIARPLLGGGTLFIRGDESNPSSVLLTRIQLSNGAQVHVTGLKITIDVNWISALQIGQGAHLRIGKIDFGPVGSNADHISSQASSQITFEQNYTISGSARRHIAAASATVNGTNHTITLTGLPAFLEFIFANDGAVVSLWNLSLTGNATGKRFAVATNGVLNLFGKPLDFLPGNLAGSTETGGIYY